MTSNLSITPNGSLPTSSTQFYAILCNLPITSNVLNNRNIYLLFIGHVKLHHDVRKCEYEDVQILWDMLKKNETGDATKSPSGRKKVRFWDIIDWAKRAPFICRSV